ncbi:MAG: hypothetical protein V3V05_07235 [Pontiella sp.]
MRGINSPTCPNSGWPMPSRHRIRAVEMGSVSRTSLNWGSMMAAASARNILEAMNTTGSEERSVTWSRPSCMVDGACSAIDAPITIPPITETRRRMAYGFPTVADDVGEHQCGGHGVHNDSGSVGKISPAFCGLNHIAHHA